MRFDARREIMDMQSFRRDALELVARRSLDVLRDLRPAHLRQMAMDAFIPKPSPMIPIAAALGGLVVGAAIGAGVAVLTTPVSGPVLRRKVATQTRRARARAMSMTDDAGRALQEQMTNASTALGISSPAPKRRATRVLNGKRSSRSHNHISA
jgi:gas vesicle protein